MEYTFDQIQNMSEEEVRALNRKLAGRAFRNFALVMGIKWGIIFGISWIGKKLYEDIEKKENR